MGYGRFAFSCSARQPEHTRFVFSSFVNPGLDLRQNVCPSVRETTLGGIPPGTIHMNYVSQLLILGYTTVSKSSK
jgi:hypothetical protein